MLKCIGCQKPPEEIREYQMEAKMEGITPSQWVRQNESVGVWGAKHGAEAFWCTKCYIEAGQPLRK